MKRSTKCPLCQHIANDHSQEKGCSLCKCDQYIPEQYLDSLKYPTVFYGEDGKTVIGSVRG